MKQLDEYFKLEKEIHDYFGYVEDWVKIPLDDLRDHVWFLTGEGHGDQLYHADKIEDFMTGACYDGPIYTQRFLPKWVYRGEEYTMVCYDTQTDGNKFLAILTNDKEIGKDVGKRLLEEWL